MIGPRTDPAISKVAIIRRLTLVFISVVLATLSTCARPSDDAWDRVRETGVLRVGMDASFPPFESIAADGALVGFDVDLAREIGRRLGVEVQFVANLPYDGLYDALAVGRVDVVISALVVNPVRMADFAYSTSYFDAGQVLVVREDSEHHGGAKDFEKASMAALNGHTLAVEFGTRGDQEARKWARSLRDLTVMPYQTAGEALAAVARGEADVALVDHVSALAAVGDRTDVADRATPAADVEDLKSTRLHIVGEPIVEKPYAVAVHRESQHLLQAIDKALAGMKADSTMSDLVARWLGM